MLGFVGVIFPYFLISARKFRGGGCRVRASSFQCFWGFIGLSFGFVAPWRLFGVLHGVFGP